MPTGVDDAIGVQIKNARYFTHTCSTNGYSRSSTSQLDSHKQDTSNKTPLFHVNNKKLKPDIVAYSPDHILAVDTQIINDQFPLANAHYEIV